MECFGYLRKGDVLEMSADTIFHAKSSTRTIRGKEGLPDVRRNPEFCGPWNSQLQHRGIHRPGPSL